MANEYLRPRIHNGNHYSSCFCICRQQKVADYLNDADRTTRELEDAFLSEMDEYRVLDELFEVTKERIVRGKAFLQHCIRNSEYVSFGAWMNTQERYANMTDIMKRKIRRNVNTVHSVYTNWEIIVENLTDADILHIDARKLSINQLYQAISPEWCSDHDESLRDPGDVPDELEYDEQKYIQALIFIRDIGLLADVHYDRRKTSIIGRRLQRDLGRMSKIGREIIE